LGESSPGFPYYVGSPLPFLASDIPTNLSLIFGSGLKAPRRNLSCDECDPPTHDDGSKWHVLHPFQK
jgi:hypothetical protein